jgi:hypothetical protein
MPDRPDRLLIQDMLESISKIRFGAIVVNYNGR